MTILLPNKTRLSLSVLCLLSISQTSYSGILENGAWQVQPGDSLYSIARQVHPGDKAQQKRFRQQLLKLNPQQFAQGADFLSAGATLALPPSSPAQVAEKKPLVKPAKKPVHKAPVAIAKTTPAKPAAVIADTKPTDDSIGKIVINIGKLEAVNNGKTRLLKRHSEIRQGDTLKTAANTHTQIRFKDGALISLKPKTEFHIAQYNYNGAEDGTER
ncbi:MAG: LysM peptidoglycan-binding domain-containing protein, partial [Gammaproteobacteria bacterium]|nr:LysM peptidoglycan-binding domain-containing protein [Gammaproteobacteria bacterium]